MTTESSFEGSLVMKRQRGCATGWMETEDLLQMTVKYYRDTLHEAIRDLFSDAFANKCSHYRFLGSKSLASNTKKTDVALGLKFGNRGINAAIFTTKCT